MLNQKSDIVELLDYGSLVSPEGLVVCCLFNEGSGNKVFDLSGNVNTGTFVNSPYWVSGNFDSAINFDSGDSDYIKCGNKSILNITGPMTVLCWAKENSVGAHQGVICRWGGGATYRSWYLLSFNSGADNYWRFKVQDSGETEYYSQDPTAIVVGKWYQVVGTYDGSNIKLYVNGKQVDSDSAGTNLNSTSSELIIGMLDNEIGSGPSSNLPFDGIIDNCLLWNHSLSASEIALLYQYPFITLHRRRRMVAFEEPGVAAVYHGRGIYRGVMRGMVA